jgi:hypothetical protein
MHSSGALNMESIVSIPIGQKPANLTCAQPVVMSICQRVSTVRIQEI